MNKTVKQATRNKDSNSSTRLSAALLFLISLLLYSLTTCRTIHSGDSPELSLAAAIFGIPHPPGYPLYTTLTGIWAHLFPLDLRAFASNLASAIHAATAATLLLLLLRRWGTTLTAAWFAGLALVAGRTFWSQAVAAEVYAFDLLLLGLFIHLLWSTSSQPRSLLFFLTGLGLGLWLGHRFLNLVYLPSIVLIFLAGLQKSKRALPRLHLRPTLFFLGGGAISILPFAGTLLFSKQNPVLNNGQPDSLANLLTVIRCAPYLRHLSSNMGLMITRLGDYFSSVHLETGLALIFALIGIGHLCSQASWHRKLGLGLLGLIVTCIIVASRYNVMDVAVFYLPASWGIVALAGFGFSALQQGALLRGNHQRARHVQVLSIVLILIAAGGGLFFNLDANNLSQERTTDQYGRDLLECAETNAVIITQGDTAVHALWYLQAVENLRPDVMVISLGHATQWHFDQLKRRYHEDNWPENNTVDDVTRYFPELLSALSTNRPISFGVDPGFLVRFGPESFWNSRAVIPNGLLIDACPKDDSLNREKKIERNQLFWQQHQATHSPLRPQADLETKIVHHQYALAMLRCGEFAAYRDHSLEAEELFTRVLEIDTFTLEHEINQAFTGIGAAYPTRDLAGRARAALQSLN